MRQRRAGRPSSVKRIDWRVSTRITAPALNLDVQAMLGWWAACAENGGDCDEGIYEDEGGIERTPLYTAILPYDNPRGAYTAFLDRYPPETG